MADLQLIYTTWPDGDTAKACAEALLNDKLIACANIFPAGLSVYRWEGEIRSEHETVMILKTATPSVDRAIVCLESHHPYEVPCIIVVSPSTATSEFTDWIIAQTQ